MSVKPIKTALLIEDNPADARLLRELFNEKGADFIELEHVDCMGEAERVLSEREFDIVVLDLGLPDADGLAAVQRVHKAAPRVPLVVLTGRDDETLAAQALQEGAQDYLFKSQLTTCDDRGRKRLRARISGQLYPRGDCRVMRVLLWHGWLLEGGGSNVYTAMVARELRERGYDVLLLCQEKHPARFAFVDTWGTVDERGVSELTPTSAESAAGRVVALRPFIGAILPVFVIDEYEDFDRVERFVSLSDDELDVYLDFNIGALHAAAEWHGSEVIVAGHAIPGPIIARRALGAGRYIATVHGSDLEYTVAQQRRYAHLAREGLEGAIAVVGATRYVLARTCQLIPGIAARTRVIPPGVDADQFRTKPRAEALTQVASLLTADTETARGRPDSLGAEIDRALVTRDTKALDAFAHRYDQTVPDPGASTRLAALAAHRGPLIGYFGKLIVQKGVERFLEGLRAARTANPGCHRRLRPLSRVAGGTRDRTRPRRRRGGEMAR